MFAFLKQKKLAKLMTSFSKVLNDLDAFIAQQNAARAAVDTKINNLFEEGFNLDKEIQKASKIRGNISQLIEEKDDDKES
jgi:hypothetical protein